MLFSVLSLPYVAAAMALAGQLVHQWYVHSGLLILNSSLKFQRPRRIETELSHDELREPSSRAALMGEQPNPWNLLRLRDATGRHRVPNRFVAVNAWKRLAYYPQGKLYPLSHGASVE